MQACADVCRPAQRGNKARLRKKDRKELSEGAYELRLGGLRLVESQQRTSKVINATDGRTSAAM